MSEADQTSRPAMTPRRRMSDYIFAVIFNIAFLVVVNKVPGWNIAFITDPFPDILWALNTSLGVSIAGNLILIFFHPRFLHHLLNAVFAGFAILAASVMLSVFPFEFSDLVGEWLNTLVRVVLIIGIVGSAIAVVAHLIKAAGVVFRRRE
jgi:hypothetical protein